MDDYMFAHVMMDPENMKPFLEWTLGFNISRIEFFEKQKSEKEGYTSKGVVFDLYVIDENGVIYNVEVQTTDKKKLAKRMRYYQSVIDISTTPEGKDYKYLKKSFIVFVCGYDPFGCDHYIYTFENACREVAGLKLDDEAYKVVVNTKGTKGDIPDELKETIVYLDKGEVTGEFSKSLDDAVRRVKASEERRREYMLLSVKENELREEGREAGLQEGREEGILGSVRVLKSFNLPKEKIIDSISWQFGLAPEEAEGYFAKASEGDGACRVEEATQV